jgi:hypothetical protein
MRHSTETTTLTISVGRPGEFQDGNRFAVDRDAEHAPKNLRHAVVNRQRPEHEGIAWIEPDRLQPRLQGSIRRQVALVLELAHALVDHLQQVRHAVGHGRVDRVSCIAGGAAQIARRIAPAAAVAALGERDQLLQDLDFRLALLRISDQHFDQFLKRQQPGG